MSGDWFDAKIEPKALSGKPDLIRGWQRGSNSTRNNRDFVNGAAKPVLKGVKK